MILTELVPQALNVTPYVMVYALLPVLFLFRKAAQVDTAHIRAASGGLESRSDLNDRISGLLLLVVVILQVVNSSWGLLAGTVYMGVALSIVLVLTVMTLIHQNYAELSMVVASIECGDDDGLAESFLSDVVFFAPTVFFIVLRPVMNLSVAVMMCYVSGFASLMICLSIICSKGLGAYFIFFFSMFVMFLIKLFTALLQTYFLFVFSSAVSSYY